MCNIVLIHVCTFLQPSIAKSAFLHIPQVLLPREQSAPADAIRSRNGVFVSEAGDQSIHDRDRNPAALARINITEQNQMA